MNLSRDNLCRHPHPRSKVRAEEEAHEGVRGGAGDEVGEQPEEQLEDEGGAGVEEDHALLAEAEGWLGEEGAAEDDAGPEAGGDVADLGELAVAVLCEVFDDPACEFESVLVGVLCSWIWREDGWMS